MNLIQTSTLDENQKTQLSSLMELSNHHDQTRLSFPIEDGDYFFLLYDNHNLSSALSLFFPENGLCECMAVTHPDKRRKSLFTQLLEEALSVLERYEEEQGITIDFCFLTDGRCADTQLVLKALEAEFWYSEYIMVLSLSSAYLRSAHQFANCRIRLRQTDGDIYEILSDREPVGICHVICENSTAYFYGFEIQPDQRRRGYGLAALSCLFSHLTSLGIQAVSLQVSGQNQPALSLYEKTGFQITETLSYYLY